MFPPVGVMQRVVNAALGGMVRSIEHVAVTIPDDASTTVVDVALTKGQLVSKCVAFCSAFGNGNISNAYPDNLGYSALVFDDGGTPTLRVQRVSVDRGGMEIYAEVVEFQPVINVYKYTVNNTSATNPDISITTVDPDYSFIYYRPRSNQVNGGDPYTCVYPEFLSGSSVRVRNGGYKQGYLYVIEDSTGGTHFSVSHYADTIATNTTTKNTTITTVDRSKTFILFGTNGGSLSWYKYANCTFVRFIDDVTIRASRWTTDSNALDMVYQVVSLQNGAVEHGNYTMPTSEDLKAITLTTAVNVTKATVMFPTVNIYGADYGASSSIDFNQYGQYLNGAGTQINLERFTYGTPTTNTNQSWQVVTWS
jgi:hypothetical protein